MLGSMLAELLCEHSVIAQIKFDEMDAWISEILLAARFAEHCPCVET